MEQLKSSLSLPRRKLIELMQEINFGRIENLVVEHGEPVFSTCPKVIRDVVFKKGNGAHPTRAKRDFVLKEQHLELFRFFDQERTLRIDRLVIQDGLPVRMSLPRAA